MFPEAAAEKIKDIADSVLKLSDFYIQNPESETPWNERFCQIAYRHYYLPLNFLRVQKVIERGQKVGFFNGLNTFVDWGCGPGTASLALAANVEMKSQLQKQVLYDISATVMDKFSDLHGSLVNPQKTKSLRLESFSGRNSCLVFSYSLTEVPELPAGWDKYEALMILEPSTSEDGRHLLHLRSQLIEAGFSMWAPCTHQQSCPLLILSKNDWCHDRVSVKAPAWFSQVEQLLPMKNKTVTTSYILARKSPAPAHLKNLARLTGDSLEEKGKTRQLLCRGPEREFLTWMHKSIDPQTIPRGELVNLANEQLEVKSNELRVSSKITIY